MANGRMVSLRMASLRTRHLKTLNLKMPSDRANGPVIAQTIVRRLIRRLPMPLLTQRLTIAVPNRITRDQRRRRVREARPNRRLIARRLVR
jgi:hypothetical protein